MMETFTNTYDEKIRPLMDRIDQARSLLSSNDDGIRFPNVVVVGDQSSGKSTLLEALSLVELPKGSGIVTRCPLVLRLRKGNQRKVYRLHEDNKKVLLDEIKLNILQYIEEETKKLAGAQKNVVHTLIELQVEDPQVRDLTVIDLPGIARNPIADQPKDIHKQTTDLIRHFIRQEGSVILCVFPANVDAATVESLALAREVDPTGIRTIGVITKSDLATNHDALVQHLLMDRPDGLHLKLGFVAVRNRSTDEKLSLGDARKREKEFFRKHSAATAVGWHSLGIDALINRLADLYSDRVKDIFPKMRSEIHKKLNEVREQLSKFPPDLETASARLAKYYELADFYVENILQVRFVSSNDGRRASMVNTLHGKFKKLENIVETQKCQLFSPAYRSKVRDAMSACFGEQLPNFLPHPVLKGLICEKLDELWKVTKVLINDCFQTTGRLLSKDDKEACNGDILLLKLLPAFRQLVRSYVNEKRQAVHDQVQELIRLEKHDPYTINHYYADTINRLRQSKTDEIQIKASEMSAPSVVVENDDDEKSIRDAISNDDQGLQDMLISIFAYWKLLLKRFVDYTALSLRAGCVFDICPGIRARLRQVPVEQADFVDFYLAEDSSVRLERKQLQQAKERLEKVDAILGGDGSIKNNGKNAFHDLMEIDNSSFTTIDQLSENQINSIEENHSCLTSVSSVKKRQHK
ncbi:unnamed protein product [Rotaria sp. Silwood2]|nr:unnamed protein product [Rotaria sp. Silwood2]CAF3941777.1 unnamed protein product [Rotaria sp. Silwood2]